MANPFTTATAPSPTVPANTAVGALGALELIQGGPGASSKSTSNYLQVASGTVIVNGVTPVTVVYANVTANTVIVYTVTTVGGTVSASSPTTLTKTPGTGFTVGALASDTSTYSWLAIG